MPFKKGDPRPANAGRKRGSTNKKSRFVHDILETHGINLVEQIVVRLAKISTEDQVKALCGLLPYVYPKLTSVEHSGEISNPYMDKSLEELELMIKKELK